MAEATGGRAINKGGDLAATLNTIQSDEQALYEVGFMPDTQADGKFHTLELKIPSHKDVKLNYRSGYLYSEETKNNKERLQRAVWSPRDSGAIELTAEVVPSQDAKDSSTVQLRIALKGLDLRQKSDRWTDQLYVFTAKRDEATQKAEVSGETLSLALKKATYDSGMPAGIPFQHSFTVKSRFGSVRLIVIDANSGRMGSITIPDSALFQKP